MCMYTSYGVLQPDMILVNRSVGVLTEKHPLELSSSGLHAGPPIGNFLYKGVPAVGVLVPKNLCITA